MNSRVCRLAVFVLTFLCSLTAFGAPPVEIVRESVSGTSLRFDAVAPAASVVITVSGPDYYFVKTVEGTHASLDLTEAGLPLADGQYTYDVRLTPVIDASTRAILAESRERGEESSLNAAKRAGRLPQEPQVYSGTVVIRNGAIVPKGETEPASSRSDDAAPSILRHSITPSNTTVADNQIVQGSLCVGLDCLSTESFGFDTIKLKENNLRILFSDTSSSAGFPTNDWQLSANDSASGGADRFFLEDITNSKQPWSVAAGAPTNSFFVAGSGHIGLGTSTPGLDLHIESSNTPAMRYSQNSGGGYTAQTWDIGANEANFFVRDVTGGSHLPFRIRPGAPTSSVDISATGDVGIGTSSPQSKLHVFGASGATRARIEEQSTTAADREMLGLYNNGRAQLRFVDGTAAYSVAGPSATRNALGIYNEADATATKVVIGSSDPTTYTLDVRGDMRVTGNVVTSSTKAGIVPVSSFNSGTATVTFTSPYPSASYAIALTVVSVSGEPYSFSVMDKTPAAFTIVANRPSGAPGESANPMSQVVEVDWTTTAVSNQ